jgi:hypothetical protein
LLPTIFLFSEILPIVFYACFAKRNKQEGLWVIFVYCLFSFLNEFLFLALRQRVDAFYLYASFTIFEYTLFTLFIYLSFKEKIFKLIVIIGSLAFYTMAVINFTTKKSVSFDSLSASAEAIFMIVYSILFLYEQIKDSSVIYVYYTKKFWITIAFFLYFSSTLFLFLFAATLTKQEHTSYWYINDFFDIIKNILFCIAFAIKKDTKPRDFAESTYLNSNLNL